MQRCHTSRSSKQRPNERSSHSKLSETFTSILRDDIKLKLDLVPIQFKKKNSNTKQFTNDKIYEQVAILKRKCPDINTGERIMFNVTFSCQDCQPILPSSEGGYHSIEKYRIIYPEKTMPIDNLRIEIEFHYFNSVTELTKLSNYTTEEIINSLITIIDQDDHQVYFKIKTNYFNEEEMEPLYRYIVIGKMDQSEHAFIFDVSDFSRGGLVPNNLKKIYDICMPEDLAKYFDYSKNGYSNTNSEKSIRRVGFGMFFRSDTTPERDRTSRFRYYSEMSDSSFLALVGSHSKNDNYGIQILSDFYRYYAFEYSGVIDVGYYKFKMGWCQYSNCGSNSYTCKLSQEVKYT